MRLSLLLVYSALAVTLADLVPGFRPPAIPVFNLSPSLHGWVRGDALTDQALTNWFGTQNSSLTGYVKVDGQNYRWMGIDTIAGGFMEYLKGDADTDRAGKDLPGSPINMPDGATAVDCAVKCALAQDCEFWSFIPVGSGSCKQDVAQCSLRTGQAVAKADTCRTSGVPPVHFPSEDYVTGVPSSDMAGNDYREFDMDASADSYECAKQCWSDPICEGFVFAHAGCDGRKGTHCWLKTTSVKPHPTSDCCTSGFGPQSAGFSTPDWSYGSTPVIKQTSVRVQPTQTIFTFESEQIVMTVTFTQPAFADDQLASSREHVYIAVDVQSNDGKAHEVQVYVDAASDLVTSYPSSRQDAVTWLNTSATLQKINPAAISYMMRVPEAKPYSIAGDYTRSNWGMLHFATDSPRYLDSTAAGAEATRTAFLDDKKLPSFDSNQPRVSLGAGRSTPVVAFVLDLRIDGKSSNSGVLTMFYDEGETLNYFGTSLRPLWLRQYGSPVNALLAALRDYHEIKQRADKYDAAIIKEMTDLTDDKFVTVLSLIHRQVTGSAVTVWNDQFQNPMVFIKEMSTGGFLSTVDVIYPASPFYLALAPETFKYMLLPIMHWSHNDTSNKVTIDWAPHDLGVYPVANADAANQEEMPVEESGNMLLMLAALAQRQNGDIVWLTPFRKVVDQWASFLKDNLPDPEDQLCTDDFLGPSPHNINLATKGIVGMAAYSVLLRYWGDYALAQEWDTLAKKYAQEWKVMGLDPDTSMLPHYKQRYDQNSTWSTKYNILFQYVLGTDSFPDDVRITENAFYQSQARKFGIPLDNRNSEQKVDWLSWMAALAFDNPKQQKVITDFIYELAHTSPAREPLTDLYNVDNMELHGGFIARFVLGGLYAVPILNAQARNAQAEQLGLNNLDQSFLHQTKTGSWPVNKLIRHDVRTN